MKNSRILVVEDEAIIAMNVKDMLETKGYDVFEVASTADEAINYTEKYNPDLILMDIILGGEKDGVTAVEEIREKHDIPIIYLTDQSDEKTLKRAKVTEPHGYIIKPISQQELLSNVEIALYKHEMEKKLKESEDKYRTLFNSVSDAIFIYDPDTTNILDANPATAKMYGYDYDELIGMSVYKFSAEVEKSASAKEESGKSGHVTVPYRRHKKKDGTPIIVEIDGYANNISGKDVMFAVSKDITDRKKADEALRESESLYRTLVETSMDGIVLTDLSGKYLFCNKRQADILGYGSVSELIGKDGFSLFTPESLEMAGKSLQNLVTDGHVEDITFELVRKDGNRIVTEFSATIINDKEGKPRNILCLTRDITERKRAEEEIRAQSKFLQTAIDALTHPFYTINVKDYSISLFNKATGIHPSGESPTCYALTHGQSEPCRKDDHPCPIEEIKVTGRPTTVEHIHLDKNGNKRNIEIHAFPIFDSEGNLSEIIEYSIDITERKAIEEELRKHRKQLEEMVR